MKHSLDTIKDLIKTFIEERQVLNKIAYDKDGKEYILNVEIFELESFFLQEKQKHNINARIDNSITSPNIYKNFEKIEANHAFKQVDYQLNLLYHLVRNYKQRMELVDLIDLFIEKYKSQFTLADLIITKSGATRCKTNIRFALNSLRELGLVVSKDEHEKRSWEPSILGFIILINISNNRMALSKKGHYKEESSLVTNSHIFNKIPKGYIEDPTLMNSIYMFYDPTHIYAFLDHESVKDISKENKNLIKSLTKDFIDFTQEGLEIHKDGIRLTKRFKELSEEFQKNIFNNHSRNETLLSYLFSQLK